MICHNLGQNHKFLSNHLPENRSYSIRQYYCIIAFETCIQQDNFLQMYLKSMPCDQDVWKAYQMFIFSKVTDMMASVLIRRKTSTCAIKI